MKLLSFFFQVACVALLIIACNSNSVPPEVSSIYNKSCVQDYNSNTDYFPQKATIKYATGFSVEYKNNYKIVTVKNPWKDAKTSFKYVLVECGTPAPAGFKETQVITIPINTVASLSTTHLPHLAKLEVVDKLVGVSNHKKVNTSEVVEKIKAGKIAELGNNVNVERLLELNPDLVTTFGTGNPQTDSHPKLLEAGLKVAINAEYMENTPLGRAEWLKFTSTFFNKEDIAEKEFGEIASKYQEIATKTKTIKKRPKVFTGFNFKGTWYVPGCQSYAAKYLADAGAELLCSENYSGSTPSSFEDVFERAATADYWLNVSQSWQSLKDVITADSRYSDFQAVKKGNIFNNNARLNGNGGNDYWEAGISNPDVILNDLIKIFHPELLPNHQLFFYQKLS
ncbi:ABC-type Fe3+-hydroxamate transport system, periplasmic component [Rivularia sp. PCC 7116]|uniref:ABC transporter substrate-binding protein n=1 Tax=Rivularia sp. PCC 7116 TaxID=373994 RepID=UPI00029ECB7F|nr:ABC transporter substrate-binding protein [Rivularia sp. PCC 7116]AFY56166.1 ABC-type Fe3+-hydroxamate transport system, periplasmic component [Rivularia sp. PCC 7116]